MIHMKGLRAALILVAAALAGGLLPSPSPGGGPGIQSGRDTSRGTDQADYTQAHRPQFHFSPPANWINDPNGLVFHRGEYHLFYQFNPFGEHWGHMSWGHAVSRDLVHWQHLPLALAEENGIMIFSGSAVVDTTNSSGLGRKGRAPLVAIYTGHTRRLQTQNLAFSIDDGRTWKKYSGNPVLNIGKKDFRDPKVFWHRPGRQWIMVVALPTEKKVFFFGSPNLIKWKRLGEFGPAGAVGGIWECPDLFELPITGSPRETKWVLIINMNPGAVAGGSGTQYFTGRFDGSTFEADDLRQPRWADYGKDFYAGVSWSGLPESDGRRIWIGWMSNWEYADEVPTSPWRGAMSFPREMRLERTAAGLTLVQRPVAELGHLRTELLRTGATDLAEVNRMLRERKIQGDQLEVEAEFARVTAVEVGIAARVGRNQHTHIGYDFRAGKAYVDRTNSGNVTLHPSFPGRHTAPVHAPGGRVKLHLLVDRSSVELFANDGEGVITDLIFPDSESQGLRLYERGGKARIVSLKIWKLASIW